MNATAAKDRGYVKLITIVSILIPIAVAVLLFMPVRIFDESSWVKLLPHVNAVINDAFTAEL